MNSPEFLREVHPKVYNSDNVGFSDLIAVIDGYYEHKLALINAKIDEKIAEYDGGDEMKSMNESFRDNFIVQELKELKKSINKVTYE
jgi:hypothetical protein